MSEIKRPKSNDYTKPSHDCWGQSETIDDPYAFIIAQEEYIKTHTTYKK